MPCDNRDGQHLGAGGRLKRQGIYVHAVADLLCCIAETNRTLQSNYFPILKLAASRATSYYRKERSSPSPGSRISTPLPLVQPIPAAAYIQHFTGPPAVKLLYGAPPPFLPRQFFLENPFPRLCNFRLPFSV